MASLHSFLARESSSSPILRFLHRPTAGVACRSENPFICRLISGRHVQSTLFNFRLRSSLSLHLRQKWFQVFASKGSNATDESSNEPQGPPLATIVAGLLVFFAVCWIIGSIAMWLLSLIINVPPSK